MKYLIKYLAHGIAIEWNEHLATEILDPISGDELIARRLLCLRPTIHPSLEVHQHDWAPVLAVLSLLILGIVPAVVTELVGVSLPLRSV